MATHSFKVGGVCVNTDLSIGQLPTYLGNFVTVRRLSVEKNDTVLTSDHTTLSTHAQRSQNVVTYHETECMARK